MSPKIKERKTAHFVEIEDMVYSFQRNGERSVFRFYVRRAALSNLKGDKPTKKTFVVLSTNGKDLYILRSTAAALIEWGKPEIQENIDTKTWVPLKVKPEDAL